MSIKHRGFKITNVMSVPKLVGIVINTSMKSYPKQQVINLNAELTLITGQQAIITRPESQYRTSS